jgi:hypothetical protein
MTDRPDSDPPAAPERRRPVEPELEEKSFLQLVPRRDLTKVALLVVLLVVVVALQRRSGAIIRSLTRGLTQPPPAQVQPRDPARVRLAPQP